ncbi:SIS domain-containing protein [Ktedonosporobacter rubrisoli]|uniref:Glutamine--fructose-6-phosphate aminotransferase [isomerizing] n=1 Tax=Ktedonosporobacter rubrisoli TaxID=2509675 RepID=A0A4P6JNU2_KTERU|nr:SIS domain-containing protein [Ktedonosporobacter rubrisoli]QBD76964.1 SIS domain-containing protein [Ktedonosporobacter rubrisoli]
MVAEPRTHHPYHMYEAIMAQPEASANVARDAEQIASTSVEKLNAARRIFLIGIGTSFHAAQIGHLLFREAGITTQAMHAFDFALYGPTLSPEDVVILVSHRGSKVYGIEALKRAHEAGCTTLLITGQGEPVSARYASYTLKTVEQDKASAHTISYCAAIVTLAVLANTLTKHRTGTIAFSLENLPELLKTCLESEEQVQTLASQYFQARRIWLVGGGPSAVTAQEIALKIKESSYLQAEGMSVEAMLHGPFQCVEPEDLFILIAPKGAAQERVAQFSAQVRAVGIPYLLLDDGSNTKNNQPYQGAAAVVSVPSTYEPLTALTCLLPLQLFTYYLAIQKGTNPDGFRLEDPRFAAGSKQVKL